MGISITKSWWFTSDSNPDKVYETILYSDNTTSCNCPGWTRRCKNGYRTCKHTRMVEAGIADSHCDRSLTQDINNMRREVVQQKKAQQAEPIESTRKIRWRD